MADKGTPVNIVSNETYLSTHGLGAIRFNNAFNITPNTDTWAAEVKGLSGQATGWLYFTIPSPPPGYIYLKGISFNFATKSGSPTVKSFKAVQGAVELINTGNDEGMPTDTFYKFPGTAIRSSGEGLVAGLELSTTGGGDILSLESVTITASSVSS